MKLEAQSLAYGYPGRRIGSDVTFSVNAGEVLCLSFHWTKPLGLGQGGVILHDDDDADAWLRRARFDGRNEGVHPKDDVIQFPNWHAYMSPETAATGLMRLQTGAIRTNHTARWDDYPDISQQEAFK